MTQQETASQLMAALRAVLAELAKPSKVLKTILGQAVARTGSDRGVFVEVSDSGRLSYRVLYRFANHELDGAAGQYSQSICSEVLQQGKPLRVGNALIDPRFMNNESIQDLHIRSAMAAPIRDDGTTLAIVYLEANGHDHFTDQHEELLATLLELAAPALKTLQASESVLRERDALRESQQSVRVELDEQRELLAREWSFGRFIGRSPVVRDLEAALARAAPTDFPVLLLGETGTGKSIIARVLHHAGPRAKRGLVTVFCPSLEKGMVETELFGHRRGAFTGAVSDRIGKVQAAEGGTLFLDEIGELPQEIQVKLLRLLQERTYERVGDPHERTADTRVIAATNRDLEEAVRTRSFRRDLYERLNFLPIRIPPLRERTDDIGLLLRHFLDRTEAGRWVELADDVVPLLQSLDFAWPGNVRSVEQLAVRIALECPRGGTFAASDVLRLLDVPAGADSADEASNLPPPDPELGLPAFLAHQERGWIEDAMRRYPRLTRSELAERLKISESALYKKLRLYNLGG